MKIDIPDPLEREDLDMEIDISNEKAELFESSKGGERDVYVFSFGSSLFHTHGRKRNDGSHPSCKLLIGFVIKIDKRGK